MVVLTFKTKDTKQYERCFSKKKHIDSFSLLEITKICI